MLLALPLVLWALVAAMAAIVAALWLLRGAVYLVIGAGYVLFACGWLIWHTFRIGYRILDWSVDRLAPPIAARWHQWRDNRGPVAAERRPPPDEREIGVMHWGYGHLDLARRQVRELPPRKSRALARRWSPDRAGPRSRSLRG